MNRSGTACFLLLSSAAFAQSGIEWPADWNLTSDHPESYSVAVDRSNPHDGASSGLLASRNLSGPGYAILYQAMEASDYRGRRVRYSANVKAQEVRVAAGLWFRVDDANGKSLAFDTMEGRRALRGDSDWQLYSIVVDVPAKGTNLLYGVALTHTGKVWIDGVSIEIVDQSVPVTARRPGPPVRMPQRKPPPAVPRNLDFEDVVLP